MNEQLALDGVGKVFAPSLVMTAHHGRNDQMIASVARLYIADGATVIDSTWGKGGFWHRTDTTRFRLIGADLLPQTGAAVRADFRALPFRSSAADVVTFDPPYVHSTTQPRLIHATYRNNETTHALTYEDIVDLYRAGMTDALRVLRKGGTCWVKCQDTVSASQQQWSVIRMHAIALELGYLAQDLFILTVPNPPGRSAAERQFHARRNHSYLWIFKKVK